MFEAIKALGYPGSYVRACVRVRKLRQELGDAPHRSAFVPLTFGHGEAFQFDWSCEYAWMGACGHDWRCGIASWPAAGHSGWWPTPHRVTK